MLAPLAGTVGTAAAAAVSLESNGGTVEDDKMSGEGVVFAETSLLVSSRGSVWQARSFA